jgi:hypothetical protein
MDLPYCLASVRGLEDYERTLQLNSTLLSGSVIEINLSSVTLTQNLLLLIENLLKYSIIISSLELIHCKLNNQLEPLLKLINNHLCTSFRINLSGSLKKQSEIDSFLSLSSRYLIGVNLATTSRVSCTPLLAFYSQLPQPLQPPPPQLLSLILNNIHLRREDAHCLHHLLTSPHCVLKELSLRSCGFTTDEENYQIVMSSLASNSSLISLDVSKNLIRHPMIGASCLYLLQNSTLKTLICEENRLSQEVRPSDPPA